MSREALVRVPQRPDDSAVSVLPALAAPLPLSAAWPDHTSRPLPYLLGSKNCER